MSDPSLVLSDAILAALRSDQGVVDAFGPAQVRVYDITPQNPPQGSGKPYVVLGGVAPIADLAQCIDATRVGVTVDVWSLTDPPGTREAKQITAAVLAALTPVDASGSHVPPSWPLAGFVIVAALPLGVDHLTDPTDQTAHSIARVEYAVDPA
jgi:hypothetical protein